MKNQYKKLFDALKLNEQKYELLKKKIYEEYRARLIEIFGQKEKENQVQQLEKTL